MAILIRNNIIIANSLEDYEKLLKKPKINDHEVGVENTSTSLEVMWINKQSTYRAICTKN